MYELQNGIQFETIPTSNAENGDFKNSDYLSIHTAPSVRSFWRVRSVDVATESPSQGSVCKRLIQMIFLFLRLPGAITARWKLNCRYWLFWKWSPERLYQQWKTTWDYLLAWSSSRKIFWLIYVTIAIHSLCYPLASGKVWFSPCFLCWRTR